MDKIQIGDRITFKTATRWNYRKATRKVTGFYNGWPTVTYEGCPGFIVKPGEIISVEGAA